MYKWLIGLAVVVGLVAVGAVIAAVAFRDSGAPQPEVVATETAVSDAAAPVDKPAVPTKAARAISAEAPAESAATDEAAPDAAADLAGGDEKTALQAKIKAMVGTLSAAEEEEMMRQLFDRQRDKWREAQRTSLPSQGRLGMLNRMRDGQFKLSDSQAQQLESVNAIMKPKMEAALGSLWAKEDDIRRKIAALEAAAPGADLGTLREDLNAAHRQVDAARSELDKEYLTMMSPILTPEQSKALEGLGQFGRGGPGGGNDGPGRRSNRDGPPGGRGGNNRGATQANPAPAGAAD